MPNPYKPPREQPVDDDVDRQTWGSESVELIITISVLGAIIALMLWVAS